MSFGLPKLPGYNFSDPTINQYHISSKCTVVNGYSIVKPDGKSFANRPLDVDSVGYLKLDTTTRFNPALIYGKVKSHCKPTFVPHHVIYANKCLTFKGYYKQMLPDTPNEHFLVHYVNIHYFLEDDTITVLEPSVPNSGCMEGRIIRRRRIEKPGTNKHWHWTDLNVNIDIDLQGIIFHTTSCDHFTREFMRSQGIDIEPDAESTESVDYPKETPKYHLFQKPLKRLESPVKLKYRYRDDVLKFYSILENEDEENSNIEIVNGVRQFIISYFVEDDTVTIKEIYRQNDGQDPFSKLLKRTRLPKNEESYFQPLYKEDIDDEEYYGPEDFIVGKTVLIFGRKFLIVDCELPTRHFYETVLNMKQPDRVDLEQRSGLKLNPFEKERQDFRFKIAKMTKVYPKDELRLILNANKYLRYAAKMVSAHPEDTNREFIFSYSLADDTIKIVELKKPNSGIKGGVFLQRQQIKKPELNPAETENTNDEVDYYTIADLYIGALINVYKHLFRITGADLKVYHYIEENKDKFPPIVYKSIRNYMIENHLIRIEDPKSNDQEEIKQTCYLRKNEYDAKKKKYGGEVPIEYPNIDYDFDAPTYECRYPIVIDGKLMPDDCKHVQDYRKELTGKHQQIESYPPTDLIETHVRPECPIDSCLAEHPYDPQVNKRVTFYD